MSRRADSLLASALTAAIFAVPAAVGAYWLASPGPEAPAMVAATRGGPAAPGTPAPLLSGVLYTGGAVTVDWNGVRIPVDNGRYAYLGGEVVSTGPQAMGVLQVGGGTIYFCPSSRASLARGADGGFELHVANGTSRFVLDAGTPLRVHANRATLTTDMDSPQGPAIGEVSVFEHHPGGVVCAFRGAMRIVGRGAAPSAPPLARGTAGAGEIVDIGRALREEAQSSGSPVVVQPIPMPPEVMASLRSNVALPGSADHIGYLCRCEELKRYAEADGIPDAARQPRLQPPSARTVARAVPDPAPPVRPPEAPSVALATPDFPDPTDPGALPPPAAGPTVGVLTVAPPLVPATGSGGGLTATAD